jgi:hypothetical protein
MSEHFNTAPDLPQTKAAVDAMTDEELDVFMGLCSVEPADYDGCLACYAYEVAQDREAAAKKRNETTVSRVCRGAGSTQEGEQVAEAFDQVVAWAISYGLAQHAEDGDAIAARILGLVNNVSVLA